MIAEGRGSDKDVIISSAGAVWDSSVAIYSVDNVIPSAVSLDNLEEASMEEEGTNRIVDEEGGMLYVLLSVTGERETCDGETLCDDESVMNESSEGVGSVSDADSASTLTVNKKHRLVKVFYMVTRCYSRLLNDACIGIHCRCRNPHIIQVYRSLRVPVIVKGLTL